MKKILFAPLQGFTDAVYRNAHSQYFDYIEEYYTPFFRLENGFLRNKEEHELEIIEKFPLKNSANLVYQIICSDAQEAYKLISRLKDKKRIDFNFGCPYKMQTAKGYGAGILKFPQKIQEILQVTKDFPEIDFSLKMRLGENSSDEIFQLVEILNSYKLKFITLHPRIAKKMYGGEIDFESFEKFSKLINQDLVYNGDILSYEQLAELDSKYPNLRAMMIGRGLLKNPFLPLENDFDSKEKIDILENFHNSLINNYLQLYSNDEKKVVNFMKVQWEYFADNYSSRVKRKIIKADSLGQYLSFAKIFFSEIVN